MQGVVKLSCFIIKTGTEQCIRVSSDTCMIGFTINARLNRQRPQTQHSPLPGTEAATHGTLAKGPLRNTSHNKAPRPRHRQHSASPAGRQSSPSGFGSLYLMQAK